MLPEIFGLIQWLCYRLQTLAVGRMAQKMGFAPCCCTYKRLKNVLKCPQNYYFGDVKMNFFLGRGHSPLPRPLPRTPPHRRLAAPPPRSF